MKTPTRAEDLPVVIDRTPAMPASSATTNDQRSGCQMNPVSGRSCATISVVTQPAPRATSASSPTTRMDRAKVHTRTNAERLTISQRRSTIPMQIAATRLNSGPTTIAPMTRTTESVTTAIDASATARQRNTWKETDGLAASQACSSTTCQMTPSSGLPGAARSAARAAREGAASS